MLAGKRAAVAHDEIGRFVGEPQIFLNSIVRFQTEIDPGMHEALTEMAVERAEITKLVEERAKIAQILSNVVRRNRRILPAFPRVRLVRHTRARAEPRVANFPDHA